MKKILQIAGFAVLAIIVIGVIASLASPSGKDDLKKSFEQGKQDAQTTLFSKEDALEKVQGYQLTKDFPDVGVTKGATLKEYYEKRGDIPAVENEGWYAEETSEKGTYNVGYKANVGAMTNQPIWEVTADSIKAINGAAITITPELGPQEEKKEVGTVQEKQIYEYSNNLYKKYEQAAFALNDTDPDESMETKAKRLEDAEKRALRETAQKFNITEEEVADIVSRLQP